MLEGLTAAAAKGAFPGLAWVPLPDVGPSEALSVLNAGLFFLLALGLLRVDFGSRLFRGFALFLVLRGLLNLIGPYRYDPDTAYFWTNVYPYLSIAIPAAAVHFVVVYRDPAGRSRGQLLLGRAVLAAAGALCLAYAIDHATWDRLMPVFGGHENGRVLTYLLVALVFAADHLRAQPGPARSSLLLVAVSFALFPVTFAAARPVLYGQGATAELALALLLCGLLAAVALRRDDAEGARKARAGLALVALAAAVPLVSAGVPNGPLFNDLQAWFEQLATLAQPLLVTYALVRFRLFDLDLRIKATIRRGTIVASFIAIYVVAAQAAQPALGGAAPFVGIAVAGFLGLLITPLHRLADTVADAAMPAVERSPAYLNLRKLEVYRSSLERALAAGEDPATLPRLVALRERLGLTERDHTVLLHALRRDAPALPLELLPGQRILGRYRVERLLGEGAHGRTYLTRDADDKPVVLKALRPDRAGASLAREARAIASVRHPAVVELREVHESAGTALLAMEYVAGGSLRDRLASGPLRVEEFRVVATDLLDALGAVHAAGIVHRDVKPSNVLLTAHGRAKLADFGIAHLPGLETTVGGADGHALGTVPYMSPEQAKGRPVTARSDLFSAAATLYEGWTGRPYLAPRPRESAIELQMRAAAAGPFRGRVPGPRALRAWFARALDPEPAQRFPDAGAMRAALLAALPEPPPEPLTRG